MNLDRNNIKKLLESSYDKGSIFDYSFSEISQIMKESSYLFYEFEDKEVTRKYNEDDLGSETYTKKISPFFDLNIIDDESNLDLINIIDEEVPFYHIQPTMVREFGSNEDISDNRDCGVNNAHSALQDNNYYEVWLRDVWGAIQNQLLLNSYNKLRWPIVGENQYITASLFPSLALDAFNNGNNTNSKALIEFRDSTTENKEDNEFVESIDGVDETLHTKIGNIDYLNNIVNEKLSSAYDILDYHPGKIDVLDAWVESLYESGQIEEEDKDRQTIIYKLQDTKYELLKRKYAGSKTLSKLILNSLDRQGSFISAVPVSIINTKGSGDKIFQDKRAIRLINLPGVTTNFESVNIYPLDYISKKENAPSLNDISSLYYTSGSLSTKEYDAENFFEGEITASKGEYATGKVERLRKNVPFLNWSSLEGLSKGQSTLEIYDSLDNSQLNIQSYTGKDYSYLDLQNPTIYNSDSDSYVPIKKDTETADANWYFLDYSTNTLQASAENAFSVKDILDINADKLIFNKNTYQKENEEDYPYVTYKIASGNSISLMDPVWMNYLETSIENKSKVQEDIFYGVQINKFQDLQDKRLGEYNFFALTTSTKDITNEKTFDSDHQAYFSDDNLEEDFEGAKYAYLCYCTVRYCTDEDSLFKVKDFSKKVVSKITLCIKEEDYKDNWESLNEIDEFNQLAKFSKGILPFTYFGVYGSSVLGLEYGPKKEEEDVNFYDDINEKNYATAIFIFSDLNALPVDVQNKIQNKISATGIKEGDIVSLLQKESHLSSYPTPETKALYYVVKKGEEDYVFSSPIRVVPLNKVNFEEGDSFTPEWYDLCYFLNPYLNFTENSASPLRHKRIYSTESAINKGVESVVENISDNVYLSNLARTRGNEFLCCDKGENPSKWIDILSSNPATSGDYTGFYLERKRPSFIVNGEEIHSIEGLETSSLNELKEFPDSYVNIFGDPRFIDVYDLKDEAVEDSSKNNNLRASVYTDGITGIKCLCFKKSTEVSEGGIGNLKSNYFMITPSGLGSVETSSAERDALYDKWWWIQGDKDESNFLKGLAILMSFKVNTTESFENNESVTLLQYADEFKLKLERSSGDASGGNEEPSESENYEYKVIFTWGSDSPLILSQKINNIEDVVRVGVSVGSKGLRLLVNKDLYKESIGPRVSRSSGIEALDNYRGENIYIGTNKDNPGKEDCFFGDIYDLRLYNTEFSESELRLLSQGSFREVYSYSPDIYVLAYNNCRDLGVFKEIGLRESESGLDEIDIVRIFNRSVWDSILLDMCPIIKEREALAYVNSPFYREDYYDSKSDTDIYEWTNGEKNLNDCVELSLEKFEKQNGITLALEENNNTTVKYNGETKNLSPTDNVSIITSTIYPLYYNKASIVDNNLYKCYLDKNKIKTGESSLNEDQTENNLGLPIPQAFNSSNKDLKYEADFTLNFTIPVASKFANFYSKGTNISLSYNTLLEDVVVTKAEIGNNNSQANHILIPLTVPRQKDISSYNSGYFDRFYLSGVEINDSLNTMLKATSYYNELRVPVAFDVVEGKSRGVVYASKWDAIRTLKEGTYYITCKYPFQILPFADYLYDINNQAKYNYLYATVRFKIEVNGNPIVYEKGKNGADDITTSYLSKYEANNLNSTLKSTSSLLNPEDNRTFPHRQINIDLYVQDVKINEKELNSSIAGKMGSNIENTAAVEQYSYEWKLLGTNHPDDFNSSADFIILTREELENSLTIKTQIPAFFSKNYTSPFFIAKTEKQLDGTSKVNSSSADDDLIDPIRINPVYNSVKSTSYVKASGAVVENTIYYEYDSSNHTYSEMLTQPEVGTLLGDNCYIQINNIDNLQIEKEADLDNIVLVAGRSYKLLWDYTGYISEFSYVDKLYGLEDQALISLASVSGGAPSYDMTDSEKTNYARMISLLDSEGAEDYIYSESGSGYRSGDVNLSGKTNGYFIDNKEYIECTIKTYSEDPTVSDISSDGGKITLIGYEIKTVDSESELPTSIPEGVIYQIKSTTKYYVSENEKVVEVSVDTYSGSGTVGSFYQNNDKIYKLGLCLDDVVYKVGDSYKVWNLFNVEIINVEEGSYNSISECPLPGDVNKIYLKTKDGESSSFTSCFRLIGCQAHFTGISRGTTDSTYSSEDFYFGNPYSRSSERNYLLKIRDASSSYSRSNIINSWCFSYKPTEIPGNQYLSSSLLTPSTPVEAIKSSYLDTTQVAIDERDILNNHHEYIAGLVKDVIKKITSGNMGSSQKDTSGIFSAISNIEPRYTYIPETSYRDAVIAGATYVSSVNDDFIAYTAADRAYPSKNEDILITRRGLYSNNLISNQDMDNSSYWTWGNYSSLIGQGSSPTSNLYSRAYVSDLEWDDGLGKDVCEVTYKGYGKDTVSYSNENNPLALKYTKGSTLIGAVYETALNIKVLGDTYDEEKKTWQDSSTKFYMWIPKETVVEAEDGTSSTSVSYIFEEVNNFVKYYNGESYPKYDDIGEIITGGSVILVKKNNLKIACAYLRDFTDSTLNKSYALDIQPFNSTLTVGKEVTEKPSDINNLYIKSQANEVTVYVTFLAKEKIVGNPIRMSISSLSQQNESTTGLSAFDDVWYNLSAEPDSIITADSIVYSFRCTKPMKFRITKAVVRKSESKIHALGLSDGIYTKKTSTTNSSVIVTSHKCISFRNKSTQEMIPVQFNPIIKERPSTSSYNSKNIKYTISGLTTVGDFIDRYGSTYESSNKKVQALFNPWVRRMKFSRTVNSEVQEVYFDASAGKIYENKKGEKYLGELKADSSKTYYFLNGSHWWIYVYEDKCYREKSRENGNYYKYNSESGCFEIMPKVNFLEEAQFYNYRIVKKSNGIRSRMLESVPSEDIFSNPDIIYVNNESSNKLERSYVWIRSLDVSNFLNSKKFSTNLEVTKENKSYEYSSPEILERGPLTVSDACVTAITNCFDEKKYKEGENNNVVITNVQLLGYSNSSDGGNTSSSQKKVLFEIEYPPIIYNERNQHLSLNILLRGPGMKETS